MESFNSTDGWSEGRPVPSAQNRSPARSSPPNGLYIRAFVVACWAARPHFDMKGADLKGRESRRSRLIPAGMASQRFVWYNRCERNSE
jgi:hypothetical protein